jgi:hypothetical protein
MVINWPKPWRPVDDRWRTYISGELSWELSHFPDHPLTNVPFEVVAMMDQYDNAVVRLGDGTFAYVLLTWRPQSPHFEFIGGDRELLDFLRSGH